MGTIAYPLSQQIADTREVHGIDWTHWHYTANPNGPRLTPLQWSILSR